MGFQVRSEHRDVKNGLEGTFWILEDADRGARAEVWPALGFNCIRWAAPCAGRLLEWLYAADDLYTENRPTRSGIPVLFPFPNRIRAGRFRWGGVSYQLPRNDPAGRNAIHGFACRHPWRVIDQGADGHGAWLTGEFHARRDAPEMLQFWPADHRLRLTIRLLPSRLRLEAQVDNPAGDTKRALPFGLGYHPYFCWPGDPARAWVQIPAAGFWALQENLPLGKVGEVEGRLDLRSPRRLADLQLDDVLTQLDSCRRDPGTGLLWRGSIGEDGSELQLYTSPAFTELVVFTPPHRQAVCLEPYTCVTDAINLTEPNGTAGPIVLSEGESWQGVVELVCVDHYGTCREGP